LVNSTLRTAIMIPVKHRLRGIKRHLVVEGQGPPLNFVISRGSHHDQRYILEAIDGLRVSNESINPNASDSIKGMTANRLDKPSVVGALSQWFLIAKITSLCRVAVPPKTACKAVIQRQRWKVERSFAWASRFRRLDRLLEHGQKTYRAFVRAFFVKYYLDLLY